MPRAAKGHRKSWTGRDIAILKKFAKQKKTQRAAAQVLGRTPAAVQQKAFSEGISFRTVRDRKAARKK